VDQWISPVAAEIAIRDSMAYLAQPGSVNDDALESFRIALRLLCA
jgi:hypothetical protein